MVRETTRIKLEQMLENITTRFDKCWIDSIYMEWPNILPTKLKIQRITLKNVVGGSGGALFANEPRLQFISWLVTQTWECVGFAQGRVSPKVCSMIESLVGIWRFLQTRGRLTKSWGRASHHLLLHVLGQYESNTLVGNKGECVPNKAVLLF